MANKRMRVLCASAVIVAAITLTTVYLGWNTRPALAMGCGSAHEGNHPSAAAADVPAPRVGIALTGQVVSINKARRTVTLRVDLPVGQGALKALSSLKAGDPISATVAADRSGRPEVSRSRLLAGLQF